MLSAGVMNEVQISYPLEAGLRVGTGFVRYLILEVHVANTKKKPSINIRSGVRVYYTNKLRQFDVGALVLVSSLLSKLRRED